MANSVMVMPDISIKTGSGRRTVNPYGHPKSDKQFQHPVDSRARNTRQHGLYSCKDIIDSRVIKPGRQCFHDYEPLRSYRQTGRSAGNFQLTFFIM
jgi:hypothetical protein